MSWRRTSVCAVSENGRPSRPSSRIVPPILGAGHGKVDRIRGSNRVDDQFEHSSRVASAAGAGTEACGRRQRVPR